MRRLLFTVLTVFLGLSGALVADSASGQAAGPVLTLYEWKDYRGPSIVVTKDTPTMLRTAPFESVHITGGVWDLCTGQYYRGFCLRVREGNPRVGQPAITVRSVRLVEATGPIVGASASPPPVRRGVRIGRLPGVRGPEADEPVVMRNTRPVAAVPTAVGPAAAPANTATAGAGATFFPAPARDGFRILACASGGTNGRCVQGTAVAFCADQNLGPPISQSVAEVGGRDYLADVLCQSAR